MCTGASPSICCAALWILLRAGIGFAEEPARLLVLSDLQQAVVVVDPGPGRQIRGRPNQEVTLPPGTHRVEVHAEGRAPAHFVVTLRPGQLLRRPVELHAAPERRESGLLRIELLRRVDGEDRPEAVDDYDLRILRDRDGQIDREGPLGALRELELERGAYTLQLRRRGRPEVLAEERLVLPPGKTAQTFVLGGSLTVLSYPEGAQVTLDGTTVGETPYTLRDPTPYVTHRYQVTHINKGSTSGELRVQPGEDRVLIVERRVRPTHPLAQMSPLSALTLLPGSPALLLGGGYPHLGTLQFSIGVVRRWHLGVDIGIEASTRGDGVLLRGHGRLQVLDAALLPMAIAVNLTIGHRTGQNEQDGYELETGILTSWFPHRRISLTAHTYLQLFSDRLCPKPMKEAPDAINEERCERPEEPRLLNRPFGVRVIQRFTLEVAAAPRLSVWLNVEGATPLQREAYMASFNQANPFGRIAWQGDPNMVFPISAQAGVTVFMGRRQ